MNNSHSPIKTNYFPLVIFLVFAISMLGRHLDNIPLKISFYLFMINLFCYVFIKHFQIIYQNVENGDKIILLPVLVQLLSAIFIFYYALQLNQLF
ncbi:MAG: hypothetical protein JWP69_1816 [Flaviaesturariibacter sp.]|nr:hypothetical protein [Flaviaesturariibacter sp.]